jgi:membrane-associated phospholipid phosphatase
MSDLLQLIRSFDLSAYHFLNGFAGNWLLDRLANFEENNNLLKGGFFFALYGYCWFRMGPDQEKQRREIITILTGTLLALIVGRTIADLAPFRMRPMFALPHRAYSIAIAPNMENWSSFPSDNAAYFFALAYGLAHLMRRYAGPLMLYTAVWICLPRMYLGVHYASDIIAGAALGITLVWASLRSEWLQSKIAARVLNFMDEKPQVFYAAAFLVCFEMGVLFDDVRTASRGVLHAALAEPGHGLFHSALFRSAMEACAIAGLLALAGYVIFRIATGRYPVLSIAHHEPRTRVRRRAAVL